MSTARHVASNFTADRADVAATAGSQASHFESEQRREPPHRDLFTFDSPLTGELRGKR